jgi:hypothetical protein
MKIRITKAPLTKYQSKGQVDENDSWIRKILKYESKKGLADGTGHPAFGFNNASPANLDEAVTLFKQQYLPKVSMYPMGMRERMADYMFNTGRNPNDLLLYNAGKISLDQLNSPNSFPNEWNQYGKDIEKMYSDPDFINNLDNSKLNVYRTTKQTDGKPNVAYANTWQPRTTMWGTYKAPGSSPLNAAVNTAVNEVKDLVPKVRPVVTNAITDIKNFIPKVGPAIGNAISDVKQFASTTFKPSAQTPAAPTQQPAATVSLANSPTPLQLNGSSMPSAFSPSAALVSAASTVPANNSATATTSSPGSVSGALASSFNMPSSLNPQAVKTYFGNMGRTDYVADTQAVADAKLQQQYPTLGATPQQQAANKTFGMKSPIGYICKGLKPDGTADIQASSYANDDARKAAGAFSTKAEAAIRCGAVNSSLANKVSDISDAVLTAGAVVDYFGQNKKLKDYERAFRQNQFDNQAVSPQFRGNYNINTGRFREDVTRKPNEGMFEMGGEQNFANTSNMIKIRITGKPENLEFEYGGQNGYGLDLGQRRVQTEMPQSRADSVSNTIREVPRYAANIEAERGETVYGDLDGDGGLEHMKIGGKRHSQGGTPLNVPEGSFIFSDTAKMKIKDPSVLTLFSMPLKKGGYTPAEIARKYDINKYKAIVEDPEADKISKSTAQLMLTNYRKKLSALATIQEEMKGFPQGIPAVAEGSEDQMAIAAYGGYLPEYQVAGQVLDPSVVAFIEQQKQQAILDELDRRQAASKPTVMPDTEVIDQTLSPKQLAALSDPEFAKYKGLLEKYNNKLVPGAYNVADMSDADAKEFARLAGKFGFKRGAEGNNTGFRVIQSSTPGLTFKRTGDSKKKAGFFGGYKPEMYERRVVEDVLGEDAMKNMSELDIRKAYFKELGVDVSNLSDDQLKNTKSLYTNKNFFEKQFYPKFAERFVGADYRTQLGDDMMLAAEHYDSYRSKPKMVPGKSPVGYKCTGRDENGNPIIVESSYMDAQAMAADGAVGSRQAASLQCPGEIIPGKIRTGEIPPEQKPGFLTPDKLALLTAGLVPPQAYLPFVPDLPYRQGDLVLEDWLSKAQQRQQTFNTAATTLGQYQPGTAMASNLSFLAGQTGEGVAQDIAQVDSRNVDRANQFMAQELQRKTANDAYNTNARERRWEGFVTTKQNLDNARRKYLTGITKAANNAFANRMYLDMLNKVNPIYNVDPRSGLSFFKQGYDPSRLGMMSSGSGAGGLDWASISKGYNAAKKSFPDLTVEQYMNRTVPRSTYSDSNADGIPNSIRTTAQSMPAMYNPLFGAMINPFGQTT